MALSFRSLISWLTFLHVSSLNLTSGFVDSKNDKHQPSFQVPVGNVGREQLPACFEDPAPHHALDHSVFLDQIFDFCQNDLSTDDSKTYEVPGGLSLAIYFSKDEGKCERSSCMSILTELTHSCKSSDGSISGSGHVCHRGFGCFRFQLFESQHIAHSVKSWASLGDSFAAGLGAGEVENLEGDDYSCSRYDHSYPNIWNQELDGGPPIARTFKHLACTGAKVADVYGQIAKLSGDEDLLTLTVTGNDIHFSTLLDVCIFRWSAGFRGACDDAFFNSTRASIADGKLFKDFTHLLSTILQRYPTPTFKLYVTGYAEFFNSLTLQCNKVTFTYWTHLDPSPIYLTHVHRAQLNSLVRLLNSVLHSAVRKIRHDFPNATIRFINYNDKFEGHRFCEPGVTEPDADRPGLWFFNWYTTEAAPPPPLLPPMDGGKNWSDYGGKNRTRGKGNVLSREIAEWIQLARDNNPEIRAQSVSVSGILPDSYVRVFHPRIFGHGGIVERIREVDLAEMDNMSLKNGADLKKT